LSKIRLGFVGVGYMGQMAHLKNYATLPDCEVVALAELRPQLAKAVAAKYGVPRVYASAAELLATEQLDGIVASQQFTKHGQIVPELLVKGVPVLTEKPLAGHVEAGKVVLAALGGSKAKLFIGYHKRSDPAIVRARQQMADWKASGDVGELRYVRINMPPGDWIAAGGFDVLQSDEPYPTSPDDPPPSDLSEDLRKQQWRFVNYYIHQINLLRHLLGEDYTITHADPSGALLVARSDSGVCATIEMATHQTSIDWQEDIFVSFKRGWIKATLPAPLTINHPGTISIFSDKKDAEPTTVSPTLPWVHAMRAQAMNFLRAIKGETTPLCTGEEAMKDLQTARQYLDLFNAKR
jgi:predicted dehydrogenase